MTNWKYIGWDDDRSDLPQVLVFPPTLSHATMVPRFVVPKSAGFVTAEKELDDKFETVIVFTLSGFSDSLNLHPRPEDSDAFNIAK